MKKLFVFLCVVFMILGSVACKHNNSSTRSFGDPVTSVTTQTDGGGNNAAPVPEPATILLLGSGLVGLASIGRKKLLKKDQEKN